MAGLSFSTLKARRQFLAVSASGKSVATKSLVLQILPIPASEKPTNSLQVGITVSGKIGKAVIRNRIKRRFRALIREVMLQHASPNYWYVLIGRRSAFDRPYISMQKDLRYALHQLCVFVEPSQQHTKRRFKIRQESTSELQSCE